MAQFLGGRSKGVEFFRAMWQMSFTHRDLFDQFEKEYSIEDIEDALIYVELKNHLIELKSIKPGNKNANVFHHFIAEVLEIVFSPQLRNPVIEHKIHDDRKRIDITFTNVSSKGFFNILSSQGIVCPFVFFECKNFSNDPKNPDIDQLVGRFSDKRGRFGVLVCRHIEDRSRLLKRCKDVLNDNNGVIICMDDEDIGRLIEMRAEKCFQEIDDYLFQRYRDLVS